MGEAWFTDVADELARCLVDARECAEASEAFLDSMRASGDAALRHRVLGALVAPTAVARALIELIDQPPELLLAAARLCHDTAQEGAARLRSIENELGADQAIAALEATAASCARLLEVAG
jgi:hypothetical protein